MQQDRYAHVQQLIEQGDLDIALRETREALPTLDGEARGQMLLLASRAHHVGGNLLDAMRAAVGAGDVFKVCGSRGGACDALIRIGNVLRTAGDHGYALTTLEQAEEMARELGGSLRIAQVVRNVGVSCSLLGRHQQALSCLNEARALLGPDGDLTERLNAELSLCNALSRQAQTEAERLALIDRWRELADDCARTGHARLEAMARGNEAITLMEAGRASEAVDPLLALLDRYRELGMRPNEAICQNQLGRCFEAGGDAARAREHFRTALGLLRDGGSLDELQEALEGLSRAEEALGHLAAALAALREVRTIDARKSDEAARSSVAQRELRIELARLNSQWAQEAAQDPLTGLGNRRAIDRWFEEFLPRAERGEAMALLLLDLDHFKEVNDRYGHRVGDAVLKRVASVIRRHCRSRDLAVRYGGEEFLLALAGARRAEAAEIGQRLRESVARENWNELQPGLAVTVSIGVTDASEAGDAAGLLGLADRRLYAAKYAGRNCVVSA